jgi:hypothetical protein
MRKRLVVSVIPMLAMSIGLFTVSQPAHAEQRASVVYGADLGNPYCLWNTWVLSQSGNDLQVTGYSWGQGYNGGACNGDVAPPYTVSMDADLVFKATLDGPITWSMPLTPGDKPDVVWNTTDFFGLHFATIPGAGLLSSGAAGLIIPNSELPGPGYYLLEMTSWTRSPVVSGGQTELGAHNATGWQYMNIPNR